jgi:hypothetical protein
MVGHYEREFMRKSLTFIIAIVLVLPSVATASISLAQYRAAMKSDATTNVAQSYVIGLGGGIVWANARLAAQNEPRLFCPPRKLALDGRIIESLLDQETRDPSNNTDYPDDTPIGLILVNALVNRFPCNK